MMMKRSTAFRNQAKEPESLAGTKRGKTNRNRDS